MNQVAIRLPNCFMIGNAVRKSSSSLQTQASRVQDGGGAASGTAVTAYEVSHYIRSMLGELRDMANDADLMVLTYFIDMALEEANAQVKRGRAR